MWCLVVSTITFQLDLPSDRRCAATLMRSRDPSAEFSDMAGKALSVEWLVENAPLIFNDGGAN